MSVRRILTRWKKKKEKEQKMFPWMIQQPQNTQPSIMDLMQSQMMFMEWMEEKNSKDKKKEEGEKKGKGEWVYVAERKKRQFSLVETTAFFALGALLGAPLLDVLIHTGAWSIGHLFGFK